MHGFKIRKNKIFLHITTIIIYMVVTTQVGKNAR